ncbi:MAG: hypothetical protein M1822_005592 [Bathelium mastoideum]|nr:MAG: hypothetical protein M1822_005592 [Bathelium mastoideum]
METDNIDAGQELASPSFWNERYDIKDSRGQSEPSHEWFRNFDNLKPWLSKHLVHVRPANQAPLILHLGCGDSTIPHDLYKLGYTHQICIDFSIVVIRQMRKQYAADDGIVWQCADVRNLQESACSVDIAFDKGTLDAMIYGSPWNPPEEVKANTGRYMEEVARTLKDDGIFLYVTYRQPHFVKPLLNRDDWWDLAVETLSDGEGSFEYYGFVLRKKEDKRRP